MAEGDEQAAYQKYLADHQAYQEYLKQHDQYQQPGAVDQGGAMSYIAPTVAGAAKVLDAPRGLLTAPLLALGLKGLTGKDVASLKDWANAANPTNLQKFPSSSEMFEKAGIPAGAKLSDVMGGYAKPGTTHPWYQPEQGGMLDPTVRGAGGLATDIAIDPLTYLSGGATGAARTAAAESAVRQAAETAPKLNPWATLSKATEAAKEVPIVGPSMGAAQSVASAPSNLINWLGKKFYNSTIQPAEFQGAKLGKNDIGQTLSDVGAKWGPNLRESGDTAVNKLMKARQDLFDATTKAGGASKIEKATAEAKEAIAEIRQRGQPLQQPIADDMEKLIAEHEAMGKGSPGTPEITKEVPTGEFGQYREPIMKTEVTPGTPAIPNKDIPVDTMSGVKTDLYNNLPEKYFNTLSKNSLGNRLRAKFAKGAKEETENTVGRTLGEKSGQDVTELNNAIGNILSTRQGQQTAQNQAQRLLERTVSPTGIDTVMGAALGPGAIIKKHLLDAARLGTMPAGYGMQRLSESNISPILDAYVRQKLIEKYGEKQTGENKK